MKNQIPNEITVKRQPRDGWFYYTCDFLPHFCVSATNDSDAYEELASKVQSEIMLNFGINCYVGYKESYADFVRRSEAPDSGFDSENNVEPDEAIRLRVIQRPV